MPADLLARLDLKQCAASIGTQQLDHFPSLISDRCIAGSEHLIVKSVEVEYGNGTTPFTETLTMPRRGFGPRPVVIMAPGTRTLYTSLVKAISPALPAPSRISGQWDIHRKFGLDDGFEYLVDLDVASCYEYIDHDILSKELLLRSMEFELVESLSGLLRGIQRGGRGLPQMLRPSDHLADAYLSIMDRQLARKGYGLHRFADDMRVGAKDWDQANSIIEYAAECARALGLVLSSQKTGIRKPTTLKIADQEEALFIQNYLDTAHERLSEVMFLANVGPYNNDDLEETVLAPSKAEALRQACHLVLSDWRSQTTWSNDDDNVSQAMKSFLPRALGVVALDAQRLNSTLLTDLVFKTPQRLEDVCRYIIKRAQHSSFAEEKHWGAVRALTRMGRQSPWAKLWLLHAVEQLPHATGSGVDGVMAWVALQTADRHEVVRAQAAWTLANRHQLTQLNLVNLYVSASPLTQPALAASAARQGDVSAPTLTSVRSDSPLTKAAFEWAQS